MKRGFYCLTIKLMPIMLIAASIFLTGYIEITTDSKSIQSANVINVKNFGAKGDGVTDDYVALKKVADYVTSKGGGEVYFPKGVYFIGVYHAKDNKLGNIEFKNCSKLKISGTNAIISVNGDFNRAGDIKKKVTYSSSSAIVPIAIISCQNVVVSNLEINGNVSKTTRDKGVVESSSHLLVIDQCSNVQLENLNLHDGSCDGLYITGHDSWSENLNATNIVSANNARQGMSLIKLKDAVFTNCKFINTGFSAGTYGGHAPSAGVDIEPHFDNGITVEHVKFDNCEFSNNMGGQVLISNPKNTNDITLQNSIVNAGSSKSKYTMILAAKKITITNCQIKCADGSIYPVWHGMPNGSVTIDNCVIESSQQGIIAAAQTESDGIHLENNTLKFTGKLLNSYFPYLQNPNLDFINNKILIPVNRLNGKAIHSLVQNARSSVRNVFYTDDRNVKLKVSYQGTKVIKDN